MKKLILSLTVLLLFACISCEKDDGENNENGTISGNYFEYKNLRYETEYSYLTSGYESYHYSGILLLH